MITGQREQPFSLPLILKTKFIKNDRGWRRMDEDRKAKGLPFYGELEEENWRRRSMG
jgi:hypothetical protein